MLIRNVHIENSPDSSDIRVENGLIAGIGPNLVPQASDTVIDGRGGVALPPFVDPHVHLDAALTAGEPEWNETGTLFDGIRIWSERKKSLSVEDVKARARRTLEMMASHGIQYVRTHVDVTDPDLTALHAMLEVRDEVEPFMSLQIVAFPQEGILSFPDGKSLMERAVREGADVVGGIPHFEFNRDYGVESLRFLVDLAERYGRLVDVHCDEIDDPSSRNLEVLATLALETGLGSKVTASHTTAMGSYNDAYTYKLFRLLKMSRVNFVSNPLVNMHLGGRFDTYPKRRGLTRVKELSEAGVNVAFGEDDIRDPWSPLGAGNMLDAVHMGVYAAQLMGYGQIMDSYRYATVNGAKALNVPENEYGIAVGRPASLIVLDAPDFYNALNEHAEVLYSIRRGRVIAETAPRSTTLHL
ncbi:cytosine deaminase [Bifidobacterium vespertilionis]|uniref:Cytosine deaminase n=1 Tax=Bifidobacterium vespertilionis TaxID=2562524 RepID=A0A5J5DVK1_9BIFI|nr:cytosine deaminase [Bifidobacterium vespertilionis]KAA8815714.1 cytosine deaminase [Bifidobacterium vespertilionis]KAA8820857.1 cytosine deaminase [Bifidobacterium vespertilionis]